MSRRARASRDKGVFLDDVLAGFAEPDDIDGYVDAWHEAPDGSPAAKHELHEHLGLTWDEYRLWVERPESIRFTIAAHKTKVPIERLLRSVDSVGAAARTTDASEAAKVLSWLEDRGRIEKAQRHF